jgi:hypothetical protein
VRKIYDVHVVKSAAHKTLLIVIREEGIQVVKRITSATKSNTYELHSSYEYLEKEEKYLGMAYEE